MKKRIAKIFSTIALMAVIVAAVLYGAGGESYGATVKTYNIDKDKLPYTHDQIYKQLFDINNKIEIKIDMSNSELQKLQKDYEKYDAMGSKSPIYRMANVTITITTSTTKYAYYIEQVGIRMKGNMSRTDFYNSSEGIYNLVHYKLNFQETFDGTEYGSAAVNWTGKDAARKARKDRTFATLEKLDMKWNRNYDNTYVREYYAYEMFWANGVMAPHTNLCSADMSNVHLGVYMIYEPIDKVFINKNVAVEDQGGDLYKCGWTFNPADFTKGVSIGIEDEDACRFYNYDLKTNKKTSTNAQLKNLINVLNAGSVTKSKYESVIDVNSFLKFAAVSYFTGNPDDMRNNYNNYYVYFMKSTGKAVFIPYDLDRCMGVTCGSNPTGNAMTGVSPFSGWAQLKGEEQKNPVYKYSVLRNAYYVDEFSSELLSVGKSKWLTQSNFEKIYNIAKKNYSSNVKPSKDLKNADENRFYFSITETADLGSWDYNISFSDFTKRILEKYPEELTSTKINQTVSSQSDTYSRSYGCSPIKLYAKTSGNGKLTYKSSNTNVATVSSTGTVTVKGVGTTRITVKAAATSKYNAGSKTITIVVKPRQQVIKSLTSTAKGRITVTHSADYTGSGFQISYTTKSDFSSSKKVMVNSRTNTVKNISGLKSGQRYYVKVRAFKYAGNSTYFGAFSEKKSVIVK